MSIFFASGNAGNNGASTVSTESNGNNSIAVGSSQSANPLVGTNSQDASYVSWFSSMGPAYDNRLFIHSLSYLFFSLYSQLSTLPYPLSVFSSATERERERCAAERSSLLLEQEENSNNSEIDNNIIDNNDNSYQMQLNELQ